MQFQADPITWLHRVKQSAADKDMLLQSTGLPWLDDQTIALTVRIAVLAFANLLQHNLAV